MSAADLHAEDSCPLHPWGDVDGLACTREAGHAPGCTFHGTGAPDGHDRSEAAAEAER